MKGAAKEPPRLRKITLAEKLGISRPTLDKYLELEGAPEIDGDKTYNVEEVAKWVEEHAGAFGAPLGKHAGDKPRDGKPTLNELKAEKLTLECTKLRHAIEVERGDYISKKEAAATIIPLMGELSSLLKQKLELELPARCIGKDTVEIQQMVAKMLDDVIARFRAGAKAFTE